MVCPVSLFWDCVIRLLDARGQREAQRVLSKGIHAILDEEIRDVSGQDVF